jgi:redox-sensitive bicupin YhaK (pirin superfamily)
MSINKEEQQQLSSSRPILHIVAPHMVTDGAGVRLRRSIASQTLDYLDPFLLLDQFRSDNPNDYIAGFPLHLHAGRCDAAS